MNIVVAKYDRLHTLLLIRMRYPMAQALLHLPLLPVELVFGCVIPWGMHYHLAVRGGVDRDALQKSVGLWERVRVSSIAKIDGGGDSTRLVQKQHWGGGFVLYQRVLLLTAGQDLHRLLVNSSPRKGITHREQQPFIVVSLYAFFCFLPYINDKTTAKNPSTGIVEINRQKRRIETRGDNSHAFGVALVTSCSASKSWVSMLSFQIYKNSHLRPIRWLHYARDTLSSFLFVFSCQPF